jgi:phage protein D
MTTASTRVAALSGDFYAPEFGVELRGQPLPAVLKGHVREIKADLDLRKLGSAEIKLSSYDDETFRLLPESFRLNDRVLLKLGYADRLTAVLLGTVVTLAPDFPEDGSPTLSVRVTDSLARLKASKPPRDAVAYRNLTDAQIAEQVARRYDLSVDATDTGGPRHELVSQRNLDDALFLKERAALVDCYTYMDVDPDSGAETLRFAGPADGRGANPVRTFVLAWGWLESGDVPPSLISFKPTVAVGEQVQSVEVRGWDVQTKQAIVERATRQATEGVRPAGGGESGPDAAAGLGGDSGRQDVVVDRPVASAQEARKLAEALLADRSYRFFTAHGRTIGLPGLRPGHNVEIHGVGPDFSRTYYVEHVTHTLSDRGFFTEFEARRSTR